MSSKLLTNAVTGKVAPNGGWLLRSKFFHVFRLTNQLQFNLTACNNDDLFHLFPCFQPQFEIAFATPKRYGNQIH